MQLKNLILNLLAGIFLFFSFQTPLFASESLSFEQTLLVGGGGNYVLNNNNIFDEIGGGTVKARWGLFDFISAEVSLDFIQFPVSGVDEESYRTLGFLSADAKGDVFSVPLLPTLLIHLPQWNNMRGYIFGGVGYQFNDPEDIEVDVTTAPGSITTFTGDIEDSYVGVVGIGIDFFLNENFIVNFDVRYQSAEFDFETTGTVGGSTVTVKEVEENFDMTIFRLSLLYRF